MLDLLADHSLVVPIARETLLILSPYGVLFYYDEIGPTDAELANLPDRASMLAAAEVVIAWANAAARLI